MNPEESQDEESQDIYAESPDDSGDTAAGIRESGTTETKAMPTREHTKWAALAVIGAAALLAPAVILTVLLGSGDESAGHSQNLQDRAERSEREGSEYRDGEEDGDRGYFENFATDSDSEGEEIAAFIAALLTMMSAWDDSADSPYPPYATPDSPSADILNMMRHLFGDTGLPDDFTEEFFKGEFRDDPEKGSCWEEDDSPRCTHRPKRYGSYGFPLLPDPEERKNPRWWPFGWDDDADKDGEPLERSLKEWEEWLENMADDLENVQEHDASEPRQCFGNGWFEQSGNGDGFKFFFDSSGGSACLQKAGAEAGDSSAETGASDAGTIPREPTEANTLGSSQEA